MVLLTAVPVSLPSSIVTGVMVTIGARPPALATAGAADGAGEAVGGAAPASGGAPASASSPPNRLSMLEPISEQAETPRPAVSAKARKRLLQSPVFAGNPLISCSPLPAL